MSAHHTFFEEKKMNAIPFFRSLTNPYARFVRSDLKIWDQGAGALAAAPHWDDTDVALTDSHATVGAWVLTVPGALPDGLYYVPIYDNASPADTDSVVVAKVIVVENGGLKIQGQYIQEV
jgi:hypothetical protein